MCRHGICRIYIYAYIFCTNANRRGPLNGTSHIKCGMLFIWCWNYEVVFVAAYIASFWFSNSEIEYTDNEGDDNRGCVCVILWICSKHLPLCNFQQQVPQQREKDKTDFSFLNWNILSIGSWDWNWATSGSKFKLITFFGAASSAF